MNKPEFSILFCALCLLCAESLFPQSVAPQEVKFHISEKLEYIRFNDRQVPRMRYAIELRDELRTMQRLCDHPEDWDKTVRAIADGAQLVELAVCHHDKKSRRTMYRVKASWLQTREYPSASVLEGVDRKGTQP